MPSGSEAHRTGFQKGNPGGPGRPVGYRQRLAGQFAKAMFDDFEKHGVAVIEKLRKEYPETYARIIAGMLPKEITGEDGGPVITSVTYRWADAPKAIDGE